MSSRQDIDHKIIMQNLYDLKDIMEKILGELRWKNKVLKDGLRTCKNFEVCFKMEGSGEKEWLPK